MDRFPDQRPQVKKRLFVVFPSSKDQDLWRDSILTRLHPDHPSPVTSLEIEGAKPRTLSQVIRNGLCQSTCTVTSLKLGPLADLPSSFSSTSTRIDDVRVADHLGLTSAGPLVARTPDWDVYKDLADALTVDRGRENRAPGITELSLTTPLSGDSIPKLSKAFAHPTNRLESLALGLLVTSRILPDQFASFATSLKHPNCRITSLDLSIIVENESVAVEVDRGNFARAFQSDVLRAIITSGRRFERLSLRHFRFDTHDDDLVALLIETALASQLKHLELKDCFGVTLRDLDRLIYGTLQNPANSIESLKISVSNNLEEEWDGESIAAALQSPHNHHLRELDLDIVFRPRAMEALSAAIASPHCKLSSLILREFKTISSVTAMPILIAARRSCLRFFSVDSGRSVPRAFSRALASEWFRVLMTLLSVRTLGSASGGRGCAFRILPFSDLVFDVALTLRWPLGDLRVDPVISDWS